MVDPANATLLGSSIRDVSSISVILSTKVDMLKTMGVRLQHLSAQDALLRTSEALLCHPEAPLQSQDFYLFPLPCVAGIRQAP